MIPSRYIAPFDIYHHRPFGRRELILLSSFHFSDEQVWQVCRARKESHCRMRINPSLFRRTAPRATVGTRWPAETATRFPTLSRDTPTRLAAAAGANGREPRCDPRHVSPDRTVPAAARPAVPTRRRPVPAPLRALGGGGAVVTWPSELSPSFPPTPHL